MQSENWKMRETASASPPASCSSSRCSASQRRTLLPHLHWKKSGHWALRPRPYSQRPLQTNQSYPVRCRLRLSVLLVPREPQALPRRDGRAHQHSKLTSMRESELLVECAWILAFPFATGDCAPGTNCCQVVPAVRAVLRQRLD